MIRLIYILVTFCLLPLPAGAAEKLNFYTSEFPPFAYKKTVSQVDGPFAEIARSFCRENGIKCSMVFMPWKKAQAKARAGANVFGLFPMGKNPEREKWIHFSKPVLKSGYGFYVFEGNSLEFTDVSQLRGYQIVTFGPSNTLHFAEKIRDTVPGVTLKVFPDMTGMVREMRQPSTYDHSKTAFYGNTTILDWKLRQFGGGPVRYAGHERELLYYIGFPKDTVDLNQMRAFNHYIEILRESGKLQKILDRWHMKAASSADGTGLVQ